MSAPERLDVTGIGRRTAAEGRGSGHEDVGPGIHRQRGRFRVDSTVHLEPHELLMAATEENVLVSKFKGEYGTIRFKDFAKWCAYDKDELCMPEFSSIPDAPQVANLIRAAITDIQQGSTWRSPRSGLRDRQAVRRRRCP